MVQNVREFAFGDVEDVIIAQEKVLLTLFFYAVWTTSVVAVDLGTASPWCRSESMCSLTASLISSLTSSGLSPQDTQPGKSGT